jgi:hypothetical protein
MQGRRGEEHASAVALSAAQTQRRTKKPARESHRPINDPWVIAVGTLIMLGLTAVLLASLVNLWPAIEAATTTGSSTAASSSTASHPVRIFFGAVTLTLTPGGALLVLVMLVGALGSMVHIATSFADFVGNRRFYSSWAVWYLLRVAVGMVLALLLYLAVRGGFFSGSSSPTSVNPYGLSALAGLAGLFSKQATDKLREVFETMFRVSKTVGDSQRRDGLAHPVPSLSSIEPSHVAAGTSEMTLTIYGESFIEGVSTVRVNGTDHCPTFFDGGRLELLLPDALLAGPGTLQISVHNPPPGGGESHPPIILTVLTSDPT